MIEGATLNRAVAGESSVAGPGCAISILCARSSDRKEASDRLNKAWSTRRSVKSENSVDSSQTRVATPTPVRPSVQRVPVMAHTLGAREAESMSQER